jgi:hypothetical protein
MIGIDALVQRRLLMDFEKRLIKVEDASTPAKWLADEIVVTARRRRGQLILTHVSAGGFSLDAVIDTGAQLSVGNLKLREKLSRHRHNFETIDVIGVTGKRIKLDIAMLPELRIGSIVIHNLPVAFADLPPFHVFGIADEPALLLGTDVLEKFRKVSLDFQARKVRFQLRRCASDGVIIHMMSTGYTTRMSSDRDACT